MEILNNFLNSELKLTAFCKANKVSRDYLEQLLKDNSYSYSVYLTGITIKNLNLAIKDYINSDAGLRASAIKYNIGTQTLKAHLVTLNLYNPDKKGKKEKSYNEHFFDSIDTEEKAYWLGFIFADGYIYSSPLDTSKERIDWNFELCAKGDDKAHMEKFAKAIGYNKELHVTKADKYGHTRCRVCLSSEILWKQLNSLGCTPRKSLTLKFPDESIFKSKDLIRHFIRGYFDGDGCFTRHIYHTIVSPAISFLGTKDFLDKILEYSKIEANYRHDKCYTEFTWTLEYHKEPGIELINYLYNNCTIYLDRKYKLYEFFKNGSRSVQEWTELSSSKIGESPIEGNTEVIEEIKESSTPYSIENETNK